ncbi:MAG: cell wall-binding repeat-containing protein [Peptostreptococcus sp.]|uniref:cell wall-binding repeat-containing protein n=1 Tax=Peptostreptococcus sp. TaxID=1262 RepID=UPI002FC5AC20
MKNNKKIAISLAIGMSVCTILSPIAPIVNAEDIEVPVVEQSVDNSLENNSETNVADDIKSEAVEEKTVEEKTVSSYDELKEAVENTGTKKIKLSNDIELLDAILIEKDVTIEGNGKKITARYGFDGYMMFKIGWCNPDINVVLNNIIFEGRVYEGVNEGVGKALIGGIDNMANTTIESCSFTKNKNHNGGAIENSKNIILKGNNLFEDNFSEHGGAIGRSDFNPPCNTPCGPPEAQNKIHSEESYLEESKINNIKKNNICELNEDILATIHIQGGKTIFKNNFSYFGGAIKNNILKIDESASVEFENNIAFCGGSIFFDEDEIEKRNLKPIDISSNSKVKFKIDDDVKHLIKRRMSPYSDDIKLIRNQGLFIETDSIADFDIRNTSFINNLSDKKFVDSVSEIEICNTDMLGKGVNTEKNFNISDSNIKSKANVTENFVRVHTDSSYLDSKNPDYNVNIDKSRFEGITNILGYEYIDSKGEVGDVAAKANFNVKNSSLMNNNQDINMVNITKFRPTEPEEEPKERMNFIKTSSKNGNNNIKLKLTFDNNTVKSNNFSQMNFAYTSSDCSLEDANNIKNDTLDHAEMLSSSLKHNTFILKDITDELFRGENNIFMGNANEEFLKLLGTPSKIKGSSENILFEASNENKTKNKNIYIKSSNENDKKKTLENNLQSYDTVGYSDENAKIEHFKPVENSYASGFEKIKDVNKDAIGTDRKDRVTMGAIEGIKENKPDTESDNSSGSGGNKRPINNYVIIANGDKYTDVLTATVLGNEKKSPILLSEKNQISNKTLNEIKRLSTDSIIISGGPDSISNDIMRKLEDEGYDVRRIYGQNRYETARKIGSEVRLTSKNMDEAILVDGTNFPDGITISSLAAKFKAPILLTTPDTLNPTTAKAINDWTIENVLIGGGYNSVSKSIEDNLRVKNKERVAGSNRYNTAVEISKRYTNNIDLGKK